VGRERERIEPHAADALAPRAQEQADLGLAEAIDRLHRVADEEERAPVARLPSGGQPLEQVPLRERRVLELVDEDVADAVVEREYEVRGPVGVSQAAQR